MATAYSRPTNNSVAGSAAWSNISNAYDTDAATYSTGSISKFSGGRADSALSLSSFASVDNFTLGSLHFKLASTIADDAALGANVEVSYSTDGGVNYTTLKTIFVGDADNDNAAHEYTVSVAGKTLANISGRVKIFATSDGVDVSSITCILYDVWVDGTVPDGAPAASSGFSSGVIFFL